jgi:hypothetical protein
MAQAPAAAAAKCLTEGEVGAMVIYAMPSAIEGAQSACRSTLPASSYLMKDGRALATRYAAAGENVWPQAKAGIGKYLASNSVPGAANTPLPDLARLPDEVYRPFVDAMIMQKTAQAVPPAKCAQMDRGAQLFGRIAPRDAAAMAGFLAAVIDADALPICRASTAR